MSDSGDSFGAGVLLCFLVLLLMLIGFLLGVGLTSVWATSDCQDFGKTKFRGEWYECRKVEKK